MENLNARILLPLILIPATAIGQTLTVFNAPTPGDQYHYSTCDEVDPGGTGMGVTWNFATLTCDAPLLNEVVDPSATGGANADFPTATAAVGTPYFWSFFRLTGTAYQALGSVGSDGNFQHLTDPMDNFRFPFAYGASYTDPYSGNGESAGGPYTFSGSITGTATGTGTLIVPYGTLTNILRVDYVTTRTQLQSGVTTAITITQHVYTKTGVKDPIVSMTHFSISVNGGAPTESGFLELLSEEDVVGMTELPEGNGITLYPVPATESTRLVLGRSATTRGTVDLLDPSGRVLRSERLTPGTREHDLDLTGVATGAYVVRVAWPDGSTTSARLLKD